MAEWRWRPISEAPRDGTAIIGTRLNGYRGEQFLELVWWEPEFDAWIAGCRQMVLASGYTFKDGTTSQLHSPQVRHPDHWVPKPALPSPPETENNDR